jgi:hypothetical protein
VVDDPVSSLGLDRPPFAHAPVLALAAPPYSASSVLELRISDELHSVVQDWINQLRETP